RRWILYPQTQEMGTGDLPGGNGYFASNALWVFDGNYGGPRPDTREPYVAWPPPGYLPYQLNIPRWSFAYPDADFTATTVVMTYQGNPVSLVIRPVIDGFGENTVVWEPDIPFGQPGPDSAYLVQLNNVRIDGVLTSFSYEVIIFDPN
ncbi:MAG: hypothetical protein KDE34_23575, partial [Anaerolineales bacterium]|nr:hypothetical protein [Anaerolineales bacterium]